MKRAPETIEHIPSKRELWLRQHYPNMWREYMRGDEPPAWAPPQRRIESRQKKEPVPMLIYTGLAGLALGIILAFAVHPAFAAPLITPLVMLGVAIGWYFDPPGGR